jgi:major histocompatibility complex class I
MGGWREGSEVKSTGWPGMVAHAFNPRTWEAEAGGSLSSRPAWSTE